MTGRRDDPDREQRVIWGAPPDDDRWSGYFRCYARATPFVRTAFRSWLRPRRFEIASRGALVRHLGVPVFGRFLPTGGVANRLVNGDPIPWPRSTRVRILGLLERSARRARPDRDTGER